MPHANTGQTENFCWEISLNNILGEGVCGVVYKGRNKATGEPVAVKTFKDNALSRTVEVQTRELEVIRKVNHENIVKLLGIELEEDGSRRKNVIVLELCTGGSLAKILEDPENAYGLEEDEFLLVLEHLTNGMKYLREKGVIHRDLKPGNILRYIADDGGSIYKLTDFDAARELGEEQEFMSLYGTEEYLHPDMYEQALLSPVEQRLKRFGASVDLWSIGVTLYHVATGSLPFRPYLLRNDRKTMHAITTKKQTGVISGQQIDRDGPIYWKKRLPKTSLLSAGLKHLITPMLAGLMEVNENIRWDFTKFFSEASAIIKRRRLHLFDVTRISSVRIYLGDEKSYRDIQVKIEEQTGVPLDNQTLLFKGTTLLSIVGEEDCIIPNTSKLNPIILCDKENNNIKISWGFSPLLYKTFPNTVNEFEDERIAAYNCGVGYVYKRQIEEICHSIQLINSAVLNINQVVVSQLMGVSKEDLQIGSVARSLSNQFEMMKIFHSSCQAFHGCIPGIPDSRCVNGSMEVKSPQFPKIIDEIGHTFEKHLNTFLMLGDRLMALRPPIRQLLNRVENRLLLLDWEEKSRCVPGITGIVRVEATANNLINKLRSSYQNLRVKRHEPVPNGVQADEDRIVLHLTERLLMRETFKSIGIVLRSEYDSVLTKAVVIFSDWYKSAQTALIQPEILTKRVSELRLEMSNCELELNKVVKDFQAKLSDFTETLHKAKTGTALLSASYDSDNSVIKKESILKLNERIQKKIKTQQELARLLDENLEMRHQFEALVVSTSANGVADAGLVSE